jgi:hypothetical protein
MTKDDRSEVRGPQEAAFTFEQTENFEAWQLKWLLDYWRSLQVDGACPRLVDIALPAIVRQAPKIAVRDAINGGEDFVNRFWGSELMTWLDYDATDKKLSEYFPKNTLRAMLDSQRLVLSGGRPVRRWGVTAYENAKQATYEAIDVPLADEDGNLAHVLSMYVYEDARTGRQPETISAADFVAKAAS